MPYMRSYFFAFFLFICFLQLKIEAISKIDIQKLVSQCVMVADYADSAHADREGDFDNHTKEVERLVEQGMVGAIFFKGSWDPSCLAKRIQKLRSLYHEGYLLCALDMEWGAAMRCKGIEMLPKALWLTENKENISFVDRWTAYIAQQARSLGIDLVLGPVADIHSNPKNPVIADRSFGREPHIVAKMVAAAIQTYRRQGIEGICVKHFPGHGDTCIDSHVALPFVEKKLVDIFSCELIPFQTAISINVPCIMTSHVVFSKCDKMPASLSRYWLHTILREKLAFEGVVITDDIIMKALSSYGSLPEIAMHALQAGSDMLMISHTIQPCVKKIVETILCQEGRQKDSNVQDLEKKVKRITALKKSCSAASLCRNHSHIPALENEATEKECLKIWKNTLKNNMSVCQLDQFLQKTQSIICFEAAPQENSFRISHEIEKIYPYTQIYSFDISAKPNEEDMQFARQSIKKICEKLHTDDTTIGILYILSDTTASVQNGYGIYDETRECIQKISSICRDYSIIPLFLIFAPPSIKRFFPDTLHHTIACCYTYRPVVTKALFEILQQKKIHKEKKGKSHALFAK